MEHINVNNLDLTTLVELKNETDLINLIADVLKQSHYQVAIQDGHGSLGFIATHNSQKKRSLEMNLHYNTEGVLSYSLIQNGNAMEFPAQELFNEFQKLTMAKDILATSMSYICGYNRTAAEIITGDLLIELATNSSPTIVLPAETKGLYAVVWKSSTKSTSRNVYNIVKSHAGTFLGFEIADVANYLKATPVEEKQTDLVDVIVGNNEKSKHEENAAVKEICTSPETIGHVLSDHMDDEAKCGLISAILLRLNGAVKVSSMHKGKANKYVAFHLSQNEEIAGGFVIELALNLQNGKSLGKFAEIKRQEPETSSLIDLVRNLLKGGKLDDDNLVKISEQLVMRFFTFQIFAMSVLTQIRNNHHLYGYDIARESFVVNYKGATFKIEMDSHSQLNLIQENMAVAEFSGIEFNLKTTTKEGLSFLQEQVLESFVKFKREIDINNNGGAAQSNGLGNGGRGIIRESTFGQGFNPEQYRMRPMGYGSRENVVAEQSYLNPLAITMDEVYYGYHTALAMAGPKRRDPVVVARLIVVSILNAALLRLVAAGTSSPNFAKIQKISMAITTGLEDMTIVRFTTPQDYYMFLVNISNQYTLG